MVPLSWTERQDAACPLYWEDILGDVDHFYACNQVHVFRPAVLMGCKTPACGKTEIVKPKPRARRVPAGVTPEQFNALKAGQYWPEIVGA